MSTAALALLHTLELLDPNDRPADLARFDDKDLDTLRLSRQLGGFHAAAPCSVAALVCSPGPGSAAVAGASAAAPPGAGSHNCGSGVRARPCRWNASTTKRTMARACRQR